MNKIIPLFSERGGCGGCEVYRKTISEDVKSFAVPQNVKQLNFVEAVVQMYKFDQAATTERRDIPLFLKRGEGGRCEVYRKTVSEDVKSFAVKQNVKLLNCVEAVVLIDDINNF